MAGSVDEEVTVKWSSLVGPAEHANTLAFWRQRLSEQLRIRPEGFSDGQRLVAGRPHEPVVPRTQSLAWRRCFKCST